MTLRPMPDRLAHAIAVCLETGIVVTFVLEHSVNGLLLSAAYFYYSATLAWFRSNRDNA